MTKYKFKISSGFIGLFTGLLLGWYLSGIISVLFNLQIDIFSFNYLVLSVIIIFGVIGLLLDIYNPIFVETFSFGICVLIFFQAFWDFGAQDWSLWRTVMVISAIGLFILNILTGYLKIGSAKKIIRRQLGIGR